MAIGGSAIRKPGKRREEGAGRLAAVLVSPTMAVLGLVVLYPIISAFYTSLYKQGEGLDAQGFVIEGDQFVGLGNYVDMFTGVAAERFFNALGNTTFFTVTTVLLETVIGVAMALVMHKAFRGRAIVRASILVPWAIPTAVSAILWRWIFQPDGAANALLRSEILWTTEGWQAKLAIIFADTWKTAPFIGLLVLAGLQTIPNEVYEAARVDGATGWTTLVRITLPLARPALLVAVLFRLLDALRMFDLPYVLIGPRKDSVEVLSMLAFDEANQTRYGPAAAYATVLFVYVAVIAFMFVKLLGADVLGAAKSQRKKPVRGKRRTRKEVAA